MKVEELIEECDKYGFEWAAEEMRYYHENPEAYQKGQMIPNFENMSYDDSMPIIHFYLGVAFGAGMEKCQREK